MATASPSPESIVERSITNTSKLQVVIRAAISFALVSGWLVLLLAGWALGGAVYLLLLAAVLVFPWHLLRQGEEPEAPWPEP